MPVYDKAKLRWRCRRGMREMDILLGDFLETHYAGLPPDLQDTFVALLEEIDQDILDWVMQRRDVPEHYTELVRLLRRSRSA